MNMTAPEAPQLPIEVLVLLYPGVEVLDAAGPFEIFATATSEEGALLMKVRTVAETTDPVEGVGGMRFLPDFSFETAPHSPWLVIPGGRGRVAQTDNPRLIRFLSDRGEKAEVILTVCTGAFLAARAGLLDGLRVTTHHSALDELVKLDSSLDVVGDRLVDNGRVVCAAGVSSGIDGALHLLGRTFGRATAQRAAKRAEYPWK